MKIKGFSYLYQWDKERELEVSEEGAIYVDYAIPGGEPMRVEVADGVAKIPDSWLQTPGDQKIFICYQNGTIQDHILRVRPRPKPPDYVATPDEAQSYAKLEKKVSDEVSRLDERIDDIPAGKDGVTPTIGDNGNWYLGDTDTGKPSRGITGKPGKDGHSPVVTATKSGKTTTISVDGTAIATVEDGADGKSAYAYAMDGGYTGTEAAFAEKLAQEQLTGTTNDLTPTQVYQAVSAGIPVKVQYTDPTFGLSSFTAFNVSESMNVIASNAIINYNDTYLLAALYGNKSNNGWFYEVTPLAKPSDIPSALPNPKALTFTGAVTGRYDGSAPLSVKIPSAVTDAHINSLIDTKLGVIENGAY